MPWLPVLAVLIPTVVISSAFFATASRREGLDRRKNRVGGSVMLFCGLCATIAVGLLSSTAPPG